ncbi:hypothetical protein [Rouxiella chamberiensis]|uniref:Uncharacterized protein n=1 Tax=Rouxiella chamberiensis TaxID=1513468 RepID=A0ABY7HS77_9GAMM|nr:hypothetical protein [Rouxiella chamberiensis]WAT02248.1 hypothetical protein O1V66_06310 [Rouxiella chamberiensis]
MSVSQLQAIAAANAKQALNTVNEVAKEEVGDLGDIAAESEDILIGTLR